MSDDTQEGTELAGSAVSISESEDDGSPRYVVGIGASAGGLEALEQLFDQLPHDTGMSYVIVQHLSTDFKSLMDEIICRHTMMAVVTVEDGMVIQPDVIYLLPAGKEMIISDGSLLLTDKDPAEYLTRPIDHFFRSLADDCGVNAVAIVLSGSGSDGSRGVRHVHHQGGIVISQNSETAGFSSMPRSTDDTGLVDISGSPKEIANALLRLVSHPLQRSDNVEGQPITPEDGIDRILRVLRKACGIDFTHYKQPTVVRRIERRLMLSQLTDLDEYVATISEDSAELNLLYEDLLIGVTQFFRDAEAFKILEEEVIPGLLLKTDPEQEIRIWSAGCATGEEAYSIAMLVHERLTTMNRSAKVKIFATDVHRTSLDSCVEGVFSMSSMASMSPARLEKYFKQTEDGYRVCRDLQNLVVFAPHNLIQDAPFTKLDLVCCRNMMIYLQPLAQKKLLSLFHFGLNTGGVLFLGASESVGELDDEFEVLDPKWKFFRKRRDIRLVQDVRLPVGEASIVHRRIQSNDRPPLPVRSANSKHISIDREIINVYDMVLNEVMPPALLLNEDCELIYAFGQIGDLLRVPSGRATSNALNMLPGDLRTVVIGAIKRVQQTGQEASYGQMAVDVTEGSRVVALEVKPLIEKTTNLRYLLVSFQFKNGQAPVGTDSIQPAAPLNDVSHGQIAVLESELRNSRESLQATIEELESSNEQLQSTNEEMVASNEELQSTNEELHSVNEELYTVNAEYQKKIGELTELTHDMDNLLNSTDVHTLFLDDQLCVRKFTPKIAREFNLIPSDVGRNIESFSNNIRNTDLMGSLRHVLGTGQRYEQEISTLAGDHFLMRILPYQGETNQVGVVLTLLDITESKEAESRFRATFDNAAVGISHIDLTGQWLRVNDRLCQILGYSREEMLEQTFQEMTFADDVENDVQQFAALKSGEIDRYTIEKRYVCKSGDLVWISLTVSLQRDDSGQPIYAISIMQDISQRKQFENQLSGAVEQRDHFLATLSHELRNPLAAVRHSLALLRHEEADEDVRVRAMDTVERQVGQVAHLLDDLLDVSRITQDKIRYQMRPLDLRDVVQNATDAMRPSFAARDQELLIRLPQRPVAVSGDSVRLLQVVENLLTNACKYTPAGGKIEVEIDFHGDNCELVVVDTGAGIEPDLLEEVFNLFVQSTHHRLSHRESGMGLGLTLVRSLVEHHSGTISAFSEGAGTGSQFTVTLPTVCESTLIESQDAEPLISMQDGSKTKIVLVEDNDDARMMLHKLLELEDFEVTTAPDGLAGVREILEVKPDIALVDIGLPEIDGYGVARQVREHLLPSEVYLIALTGYGQTKDIQKSEAAGFDHHLNKPVDPVELTKLLRSTSRNL